MKRIGRVADARGAAIPSRVVSLVKRLGNPLIRPINNDSSESDVALSPVLVRVEAKRIANLFTKSPLTGLMPIMIVVIYTRRYPRPRSIYRRR